LYTDRALLNSVQSWPCTSELCTELALLFCYEAANKLIKTEFNQHCNNWRNVDLRTNMFVSALLKMCDRLFVHPLAAKEKPPMQECSACKACRLAKRPEDKCGQPSCTVEHVFPHQQCNSHCCPHGPNYSDVVRYDDIATLARLA
jgi:hypothetical protein